MPEPPDPARLRVGGSFDARSEGTLKVFTRGGVSYNGPSDIIGFRTFRPHLQVKEPTHGNPPTD